LQKGNSRTIAQNRSAQMAKLRQSLQYSRNSNQLHDLNLALKTFVDMGR